MIEPLERRSLLSSPVRVAANGFCIVNATNLNDEIYVTAKPSGGFVIIVNGKTYDRSSNQIFGFEIHSYKGNDTIQFRLPAKAKYAKLRNSLYAGLGDDVVVGSAGRDAIWGDSDNDIVRLLDNGNDILIGRGQADTLHGGTGNDVLRGDAGRDVIFGDEGNDTIFAGDGDDQASGDPGNDVVYGQNGNDSLVGGYGSDTVIGGLGRDAVYGTELFYASIPDKDNVLDGELINGYPAEH
jgi:Ca2+-binding RTX toxin-like protein